MENIKIAIDGPAGAGKSTIAKIVAKELGFIYVDTGAMYRAVALKAIKENIDTKDINNICNMLSNLDIDIKYIEGKQAIFLDNKDVTCDIRTPQVSVGASNVAVIPQVRLRLVELQRKIASENNVIMDGRDIGTYVLPDAQLKVFLTASTEERAKRRYEELKEKGIDSTFEKVKQDIMYRDKNDKERQFAPLKVAKDAVIVDTTDKDINQTVDQILNIINGRLS